MNKDCKLIFEAYLAKTPLIEAPICGDDLSYTGDFEKAPGGGYGIGKAAAREGKSKTDIANQLLNAIKTKLFKPESHMVDGKEYSLYYPGSKMKFRSDLEKLIKSELKIGGTEAKYTARVVDNLLNVVKVDLEGGTSANPIQVKKAVTAGIENKPVSKSGDVAPAPASAPVTPAKSGVFMKNPNVRFIREWMPIFNELPDEINISGDDVYDSKELRNAVIDAITSAYDDSKSKDKELVQDFIDSLKFKNSYLPYKEKQEGEGTGEVETVDEYPEEDEPTALARELGYRGGRSFDEFDKYSTI